MSGEKEISVLFSGGSDSTLAAAICCQKFEKVHLLTFHHTGMHGIRKSQANVERLEKKFGKEKLSHRLINIETAFRELYYGNYIQDLKRYKGFLAAATCNICQLAMHTETVIYNLKEGISFACDGYKREKEHVYIVMAKEGVELLREFYRSFGITYSNPVYDIPRTDRQLYGLGITPKENVKFPYEHLSYEAQHSCFHGIITNAYLLGYYYPLHHNSPSRRWIEYFKEKVETANRYVAHVAKE